MHWRKRARVCLPLPLHASEERAPAAFVRAAYRRFETRVL